MSLPSSLPSFVVVLQRQRRCQFVAITFFSMFENKKNTTIDFITFFNGFDAKKVTTVISSLTFMVVVL
jgi:hypothetical protein